MWYLMSTFKGTQGDPTSPFWRRSALGFLWREWCWSWNSSTLATSCEELTHWKRLWCWEGLGAGGEGDDRGWDGWMASLTPWTWAWVNSGSWWWTGRPGVLQSMGSQTVEPDWAAELNWCHSCYFQVTLLNLWVPQKEIKTVQFEESPFCVHFICCADYMYNSLLRSLSNLEDNEVRREWLLNWEKQSWGGLYAGSFHYRVLKQQGA